METEIRELIKTVSGLQNKVLSLEKLVLEQNTLIKKLVNGCETKSIPSKTIVDVDKGGSGTLISQRPVRNARAKAMAALSVPARQGKKGSNILPVSGSLPSDIIDLKAIAGSQRVSSSHSAPPTPSTPTLPQFLFTNTEQVTDAVPEASEQNYPTAEWTEVRHKRSRRTVSANVTRGTAVPGSTACSLSAAERKSYLHLYYVQSGTTAEMVENHLRNICPGDRCSAESLKSRGDYASFKLTIPMKNIDKYLSPEHWAEDVYVKPWRSGFRNTKQGEQK